MSLGELRAQNGLIWGSHLNGNSNDFSGNGNNGTDTAITYSQANGKFGQGAGFNGSNSNIQINSLPALGDCTICAYIKMTGNAQSGYSYIFTTANPSNDFNLNFSVEPTTNYLSFGIYTGNWLPSVIGNYNMNDSLRHMVAVTRSGANIVLYMDGKVVSSSSSYRTGNAGGDISSIGSNNSNSNTFFTGSIDEVTIFTVAKSASWVKQQYSLGRFGEL